MIRVQVPDKLIPIITKPKPLKIIVGGRGSAKSETVAQVMLKFCDDGDKILGAREFQNSLDDSVHSLLKRKIVDLKADSLNASASDIESVSGGKIFYRGLARNIGSIKSLDYVKYVWIEEGQYISQESIDLLFPTIRTNGAEIWVTMNRGSVNDPICISYLNKAEDELSRCGYYEDDYMMVVEINWRDNPWFPEILNKQRLKNYDEWPRAKYDHVWEGKYSDSVDNAIIMPDWFDACVDAHLNEKFATSLAPKGAKIAAFDPSDTGDAKGYAYRHGSVFLDVCDSLIGDVNDGCDWATSKAISQGVDWFTWDCDGIGSPLSRPIQQAFNGKRIEHVMFKGSESPDDPKAVYTDDDKKPRSNEDTFKNKRAQYYWRLRDRIYNTYRAVMRGDYVDPEEMISFSSQIPDLKRLRAEVCRIPRKTNANGYIQIMSKPDMKSLGIQSPNMADAVMMTMMTQATKAKAVTINFAGW